VYESARHATACKDFQRKETKIPIQHRVVHCTVRRTVHIIQYEYGIYIWYPADTHTASLLLYVSTWAILDKKTQG
jgi:hypothetical protein